MEKRQNAEDFGVTRLVGHEHRSISHLYFLANASYVNIRSTTSATAVMRFSRLAKVAGCVMASPTARDLLKAIKWDVAS